MLNILLLKILVLVQFILEVFNSYLNIPTAQIKISQFFRNVFLINFSVQSSKRPILLMEGVHCPAGRLSRLEDDLVSVNDADCIRRIKDRTK